MAASLRKLALVRYDAHTRVLSTPIFAPLPEIYARSACLCSGTQARIDAGRFFYDNVPSIVATTLITLAGQQHPGFIGT